MIRSTAVLIAVSSIGVVPRDGHRVYDAVIINAIR
jgi:hypothetical protein